tara:strand:+ start:132 stop:371 length:240 start_codon:yes stop_codon:yes gene_type:complete
MHKWEYKKINILEDLEYYDEALNNADNQIERDYILKQAEISYAITTNRLKEQGWKMIDTSGFRGFTSQTEFYYRRKISS